MPIDPTLIALLVAVAFVAGFVDAVAGGGGLVTLPALLLAGMGPVEAVATNKLQGTFGVAASSHAYWKAGHLDVRDLAPALAATAAGAAAGGLLVSRLDPAWLRSVVPAALIAIALYFALQPGIGRQQREPKVSRAGLGLAIGFPVGLYDGFLGPGAGSIYLVGLLLLGGYALIPATAATKLLNLVSNAVALAVFLTQGNVSFAVGLPMAAGQILGARLGAYSALKSGAALIRPLVFAVSLAMAFRLLLT